MNDIKKLILQNENRKFEEIISNTIYDNCLPNIMSNIYSVRVENKTLLVVHFYPSSSKPHYIKSIGKRDGIIQRIGSTKSGYWKVMDGVKQ